MKKIISIFVVLLVTSLAYAYAVNTNLATPFLKEGTSIVRPADIRSIAQPSSVDVTGGFDVLSLDWINQSFSVYSHWKVSNPLINVIAIDIYDVVEDVSVCVGALEADVLALLVDEITISNSPTHAYTVGVQWSIASFDGTVAGDYIATGTFELPAGVSQTEPPTVLEVYATITVNAPTVPVFSFNTELCLGSGGMQFPSMSDNDISGMWNPGYVAADVVGVVNCEFIVDTNQCAANVIVPITVHALPEVTCQDDFSVTNINPVTITSTPVGGTYSGIGIIGNKFSANAIQNGNYTITYTYSDLISGCSNSCEFVAAVNFAQGVLTSIDDNHEVEDVSVCMGAVEADVLALLVDTILISNAPTHAYSVGVQWSIASFDGTVAGDYIATGTFELPDEIAQMDTVTILEVYASITVNAPTVPIFSFNTELCLGSGGMQFPSMSDNDIYGMWNPGYVSADVVGAVNCEFVADANQCATNVIVPITVHALPEVTCQDDLLVTNFNPVTLTSTPEGGIYSGDGVMGDVFSAIGMTDGESVIITYEYTDEMTGCSNSCEFTINIVLPSNVIAIDIYDVVEDVSVCVGALEADVLALLVDEITISNSPTHAYTVGVQWSIASFDGTVAGDYIATGTFELPAGVSQTEPPTVLEVYATITVNAPTVPVFSFNTELCLGSGGMQFPSMSDNDISGMWNPGYVAADVVGVVNCEFIVDTNQCAANVIVPITVHALPEVTCQDDFSVTNINPVTITSTPVGGTYSGIGIIGNKFSANAIQNGNYTITYTYSDLISGCSNSCEFVAAVNFAQGVLTSIDDNHEVEDVSVCMGAVEADVLALLVDTILISNAPTHAYSVGVQWSIASFDGTVAGDYIATGTFELPDEIAQMDTVTILEVYASITVNAPTVPIFSFNTELCLGSGGMQFPSMSDNDIYGMWNPGYVSADVVGAVNCEFVADANQCATNTIVTVTVSTPVLPTFSFETELCLGSGGMQFPSMSDNGILGMWNPAYVAADVAGAVSCEFTVDANQCATNTIVTVTINALPVVTCPADFTVTQQGVVALSGAAPAGGTYSGTGVTGSNFNPSSLTNGAYTITYNYTDATTGCSDFCEFIITVDITSSIAVNEIATIGIYPNPNNGMFTINFANISGKANYQIYDAKGSIIVNKNIHTSGNTTEDVSLNLVPGVYFIKVVTTNQTIVEKLVIQ